MPNPPHDPPFRAEHVGSFLRPPEVLQARADHAAGRISAGDLRAREDKAIRAVVALQQDLGFKLVTDGEYRRGTYSDNFTTSGLSGVEARETSGDWAYQDAQGHRTPARLPVVTGRIRWHDSPNAGDFTFLKSIAAAVPKITLPGPCYLHYRAGRANISREVYPKLDDFWADLVAAYRIELEKLSAAGCRYVQLDETSLAKLGDPKIRTALAERGDDWQALLDIYTDVTNAVVAAAPAGMRIGMHLCRGNNQGHWQAAGGYDVIAETLFRKLDIDFFFLEYDSPRAGSFEPLRMVPEDKTIVLGLVSTKVAELETADLLRARIAEARKYLALDQLALSPQCGFASSHQGNALSYEQQVAKLRRVIEVVQQVW